MDKRMKRFATSKRYIFYGSGLGFVHNFRTVIIFCLHPTGINSITLPSFNSNVYKGVLFTAFADAISENVFPLTRWPVSPKMYPHRIQ